MSLLPLDWSEEITEVCDFSTDDSSVVAAPPIEDMISVGAKKQEGLVSLIPSKSLSDYVPIYCSCKILYTSVRRDRPAAGVSARSREFGDRCGCH